MASGEQGLLTNTHVAKIIRQRQNPFAGGSVEAKAS